MTQTITASINVAKIDKSKLYEGKKGKYLDIVLIPTPDNQYGNDYMVVQSLSKEARDAGERGEILGNAKIAGGGSQGGSSGDVGSSDDIDEDVPF